MTCSEVQQVLPELLDEARRDDTTAVSTREGFRQEVGHDEAAHLASGNHVNGAGQVWPASFPPAFQNHLRSCDDCSDLVSDLRLIANESRALAEEYDPAPRVWVRIAAELHAEGIIKDPVGELREQPLPAANPARWPWSALWLAPVAALILAAGAYVINQKPASPGAPAANQAQSVARPTITPTPDAKLSSVAVPSPATPATASAVETAKKASPPRAVERPAADPKLNADASNTDAQEAAANHDDQEFLSAVSTRAPSMRATYQNQLDAVNADIRETQAYVKRNPGDADARQHLMDAFEQKALLYQMALDRIQ